MTPAVDMTLMTLGQPEPTLQLQVIPRNILQVTACEQAHHERCHHHRHLLKPLIMARCQTTLQAIELFATPGTAPTLRVQSCCDLLDFLGLFADRLLFLFNRCQTTVDTARQTLQLILSAPPFFQ